MSAAQLDPAVIVDCTAFDANMIAVLLTHYAETAVASADPVRR